MNATKAAVEQAGTLVFDLRQLTGGFQLPPGDVVDLFRDGRRAQPVMERRLLSVLQVAQGWSSVACVGGGRRLERRERIEPVKGAAFTAGEPFDVVDRYDVRVFRSQLAFAPSWMKGTGRYFTAGAFEDYVKRLAGVFVVDVERFPECPYWRVPSGVVLSWAFAGLLGTKAAVKRAGLPALLEGCRP